MKVLLESENVVVCKMNIMDVQFRNLGSKQAYRCEIYDYITYIINIIYNI